MAVLNSLQVKSSYIYKCVLSVLRNIDQKIQYLEASYTSLKNGLSFRLTPGCLPYCRPTIFHARCVQNVTIDYFYYQWNMQIIK